MTTISLSCEVFYKEKAKKHLSLKTELDHIFSQNKLQIILSLKDESKIAEIAELLHSVKFKPLLQSRHVIPTLLLLSDAHIVHVETAEEKIRKRTIMLSCDNISFNSKIFGSIAEQNYSVLFSNQDDVRFSFDYIDYIRPTALKVVSVKRKRTYFGRKRP